MKTKLEIQRVIVGMGFALLHNAQAPKPDPLLKDSLPKYIDMLLWVVDQDSGFDLSGASFIKTSRVMPDDVVEKLVAELAQKLKPLNDQFKTESEQNLVDYLVYLAEHRKTSLDAPPMTISEYIKSKEETGGRVVHGNPNN